MRRRAYNRLRIVGAFAILSLFLAGGELLRHLDLSTAANVAQLLSLLSLIDPVLSWRRRRRSDRVPPTDGQLDGASTALARVVLNQWQREANARGLLTPTEPLEIRWSTVPPLQDNPANLYSPMPNVAIRPSVLLSIIRGHDPVRLAIVGGPGSGKTSQAILVALNLLHSRTTPADRVAVLLSLSTWLPDQVGFHKWIIQELERNYGWLKSQEFGSGTAAALVSDHRLILILDGLDEIAPNPQQQAIEQMNATLDAHSSVILTCRESYYQASINAADVLFGTAVIHAQPLTTTMIATYLESGQTSQRSTAWAPVLHALRSNQCPPLRSALSSPLMVSLARRAYASNTTVPSELLNRQRFPDEDAVTRRLMQAYVSAVYSEPGELPEIVPTTAVIWSPDDAQRWLHTIALQLQSAGTVDFAWWRLRDSVSSVGLSAAFFLLAGTAYGVVSEIKHGSGWLFGLAGAISAAFASAFRNTPEPRYRHLVGLGYFRSGVRLIARISLVILACWIGGGSSFAFIGGAFGAVILSLSQLAWIPVDQLQPLTPALLLKAHRTLFLKKVAGGAVAGSLVGALLESTVFLQGSYFQGATAGLIGGLGVAGLTANAWIGYTISRIWFAVRGTLPWQLMTFLDDAHTRGALRQFGPIYQFRHSLLQKFLADN